MLQSRSRCSGSTARNGRERFCKSLDRVGLRENYRVRDAVVWRAVKKAVACRENHLDVRKTVAGLKSEFDAGLAWKADVGQQQVDALCIEDPQGRRRILGLEDSMPEIRQIVGCRCTDEGFVLNQENAKRFFRRAFD